MRGLSCFLFQMSRAIVGTMYWTYECSPQPHDSLCRYIRETEPTGGVLSEDLYSEHNYYIRANLRLQFTALDIRASLTWS